MKFTGMSLKDYNITGHLLHAQKLGFIHPTAQKYMEFFAPIPEEFENILNKLENREKSASN